MNGPIWQTWASAEEPKMGQRERTTDDLVCGGRDLLGRQMNAR
jgi:hypothetical protein